jgi:hypothetical protein
MGELAKYGSSQPALAMKTFFAARICAGIGAGGAGDFFCASDVADSSSTKVELRIALKKYRGQ